LPKVTTVSLTPVSAFFAAYLTLPASLAAAWAMLRIAVSLRFPWKTYQDLFDCCGGPVVVCLRLGHPDVAKFL
jgi:hypothetical protein